MDRYKVAIDQAKGDTNLRDRLERESARDKLRDKDLRRRAMEGDLDVLTDIIREWDYNLEEFSKAATILSSRKGVK